MRTGASSESSRDKAIRKQMSFLAGLFEEAIVQKQCERLHHIGEGRLQAADECLEEEAKCRRGLAKLERMTEEVTTWTS